MIIATIGNTKLKLESLEEAKSLLKLIAKATPVQSIYTDSREKYYVDEGGITVGIEIIHSDKLHTPEEIEAIRAKKSDKPRLEVA